MMTRQRALMLATIQRADMPIVVKGMTIPNRKRTRFMIVLNNANDAETDAFALEHELAHIRMNHFDDPRPIQEIEAEADALALAELNARQNAGA